MRTGRVIALVIGCLLVIPGLAMLLGGGGLLVASLVARDDDGYFHTTLDRFETSTVAITAEDLTFAAEPGSPDWLVDALDADVRLRVTSASSDGEVFAGIGPAAAVDAYLAGVGHDELVDVDAGAEPEYRRRTGGDDVDPPIDQEFWEATAAGPGTQELLWEATSGRWAAVVMNADGSPGVAADVDVGVKAGFVIPLGLILLGAGAVLTAGAVALIVAGATGGRARPLPAEATEAAAGDAVDDLEDVDVLVGGPTGVSPLSLNASLDPALSRWMWLVKWFLAIPHFVVLVFLWIAFVVLTVIAGFSILFTGSYPRGIFDFNVGVLRWSWRVSYYATTGGVGTDRYPPFSLGPEPGYPATLHVAYPGELSRGLVLVKWWLLAIPHYVIVSLLAGGAIRWTDADDRWSAGGGGLLGILVVIAGVVLLFRGQYPRSLFDLIIGFNRWIYRVIAYAALMTDRYPPFRLDQGGVDPAGEAVPAAPAGVADPPGSG